MTTPGKILLKIAGFAILAGIVFGLFVVVVAPFTMYEKAKAESWPARKGVVTLSYASHKGVGGFKNAPYWVPEICGRYKDNGELFCARRVRYGGFRWGDGKAEAFDAVARYPVGSEIDVYHSPDDPRETVLEAVSPWTEMYALLGLAIACLSLPVALWLLRKRLAA